jgi:hypothetical protein
VKPGVAVKRGVQGRATHIAEAGKPAAPPIPGKTSLAAVEEGEQTKKRKVKKSRTFEKLRQELGGRESTGKKINTGMLTQVKGRIKQRLRMMHFGDDELEALISGEFVEEQRKLEKRRATLALQAENGMPVAVPVEVPGFSALSSPKRITVNFIASGLVTDEELERRRLSRLHGVPLNEVEDIHKVFAKFDVDGSGAIEFEEFQELMFQLLGVKDPDDYPMDRMRQFWSNVDLDGSGEVDFEEFLLWFRKYFSSPDGKTMSNPAESFYSQLQSARMPRLQEEGGLASMR